MRVRRRIRFYEKQGEKWMGEILLEHVEVQDLLNILDAKEYGDDLLLFDCYPLDKIKLDKLSKLTKQFFDIDLTKYDYFLEVTGK